MVLYVGMLSSCLYTLYPNANVDNIHTIYKNSLDFIFHLVLVLMLVVKLLG